jgi:hypothetical protein
MGILTAGLAAPVALAVVAMIGYLAGRRRKQPSFDWDAINRKLAHANDLIVKAESISDQLRRSMATHHCTVSRFREQFQRLSDQHRQDTDPAHHMHLQEMLGPTERLSDDIALAYDELRQQAQALERLRNS